MSSSERNSVKRCEGGRKNQYIYIYITIKKACTTREERLDVATSIGRTLSRRRGWQILAASKHDDGTGGRV